jgi:hypothetical protein
VHTAHTDELYSHAASAQSAHAEGLAAAVGVLSVCCLSAVCLPSGTPLRGRLSFLPALLLRVLLLLRGSRCRSARQRRSCRRKAEEQVRLWLCLEGKG